MTARNALIRRLPAVETLGSVTVIATDKTGTLTEGRMTVRRLWTPAGWATVDGVGYRPEGRVRRGDQTGDRRDRARPRRPARRYGPVQRRRCAAAWGPSGRRRRRMDCGGDSTEAALLAAAGRLGLDPAQLSARYPRFAEVPFESGRKRMTTAHQRPDGGVRIVCKGAPEVLLHPEILVDPPDLLTSAAVRSDALAREGFRVLAVAQADRAEQPVSGQLESGLRLLGLVAILDRPRPAAAPTIAACQAAGTTPVLITGDHPATARAIAVETGIIEPDGEVVNCRQLTDPGTARVFARATPEQKLAIPLNPRLGGGRLPAASVLTAAA